VESRQTHLLLIDPDPHTRWLGPACALRRDGDLVTVLIAGSPLLQYGVENKLDSRLAAAIIANAKAAPIQTILEAFELDDATLWRARQRIRKFGVAGLLKGKAGPKGASKLVAPVVRRILSLRREQKLPLRSIAVRLRISHTAVRTALLMAGESCVESGTEQTPKLPFGRESLPSEALAELQVSGTPPPLDAEAPGSIEAGVAAPVPSLAVAVEAAAPVATLSTDAVSVSGPTSAPIPDPLPTCVPAPNPALDALPASKRASTPEEAAFYAKLGFSYDGEAEVVFESQVLLPCAGFLLAIPALAATGLFDAARQVYGGLHRGVYGLRATMLVLAMLAMLRRPRPENLKDADPAGLGDVIGLLRAPEVKTIRRKLEEIASVKKAHALMEGLARRWLAEKTDDLGTLYVDGHVRDYHGKHALPKAHISQRNLCAPATTDYWVNGVDGDPVFVVTATANAAMTQMLPIVIDKAEELSGGRKGTIVFDRGGWSPDLFKKIIEKGWHILTYRKGTIRKHPRNSFQEQSLVIDGKERRYTLSERNVRLRNGLKLREIAELRDDGGQTIILSSHFDKNSVLLAYRMFERWRQENFFRYMKENFAIDALVDYDVEPDDPLREVPNPARKALDKKLAAARTVQAKLEREYGAAAVTNTEAKRPTMRGFKIANGDIGIAIREAKEAVDKLKDQRALVPKRVTVAAARGKDEIVKLSPERKLFTDAIKAACYRAETTLLRLLEPDFARAEDEGRNFLREAMKKTADLQVDGDNVTVRFAPLSAPRFTAALRGLCKSLNGTNPTFPETSYRLHFTVAETTE